jgi:uncharacterized protein YdeI (YjbR/CyaY-like superfamily)
VDGEVQQRIMGKKDPRIDVYIAKSAEFARPILKHLRKVVHAACPEVEETIKWSFPHFDYKGEMMCSMASFKGHCAFGFWKSSLVLGDKVTNGAMGQLGRITSIDDLPAEKTLTSYVKKAARLNDAGIKAGRAPRRARPELEVPEELTEALKKSKALTSFEALPPSHRREYVEWIVDAKREDTRKRRLATAVEWIAEGKSMNWKYGRQPSSRS